MSETVDLKTIVKLSLRKTKADALDAQVDDLILSAKIDLGIAGVELSSELDAAVRTAICTYVQLHYGQPDEYERLKQSYDEQKAQLATCTGYTNWGGV